jgi:signal transduction histidine kinase
VDWCVAVILTGLAQVQLYAYLSCCGAGHRTWTGFLLTLLETLPIAMRRRWPLAVLGVSGGAAIAQLALHSPVTDFGTAGVLVAFTAVATDGDRRVALGLAAITPVGILVAAQVVKPGLHPHALLTVFAEFAAAWLIGDNMRYRRRHVADQTRAVAAAERSRIARELHDVVAHGLSLISIQAAAARTVMDATPERARESLRSIEAISRESWTEMRRFLDGVAGGEPGLGRLAELIERFEGAGLSVDLVVNGPERPLPAVTDLCAYRVVQESLTNALRHAGSPSAQVTIGYDRGGVELEIANQRRRGGGQAAGGIRYGLTGMHERVALAGGQLSVEDRADRFTVRARLPALAGHR